MVFRFCGAELDDERRRLGFQGREVVVQRRVFDLLCYLLRHRDRVVSKDELVEAVWEGAFVADGAVQRAVSVARRVLREGGAPDAIRTYSRQGYRFCCPLDDGGAGVPGEERPSGERIPTAVAAARAAYTSGAWAEAMAAFAAADAEGGLEGGDLERWGRAAENAGASEQAVIRLERAVPAFAAAGDRRGAARAAIRLANLLLERREGAVGKGWLRRAERFLRGDPECSEAGFLAWLTCRFALFDGDLEVALEQAERCFALGSGLEDSNLEALGLVYRGFTLLALGETDQGPGLLDEAGATVLAGQTDPWVGGFVFCGIIWACINRGDFRRAAEWTEHLTRWCAAHDGAGYPGICRLHRAEVLTLRGDLAQAEREANEAREMLARSTPWAEGDAYRVLGEIHLQRGDLEGADEAFRRAHELGWDAQPGLALLQVARGRGESAVRGLERALCDPGWKRQRRGLLLAHLVLVAAAAGEVDRAKRALAELDGEPALWALPAVAAVAARARGELALAEGRTSQAARHLQDAARIWHEFGSPANGAGARLRLAHCLAADGDRDGAELELSAAEAAFAKIGLPALVASCRSLRETLRLR